MKCPDLFLLIMSQYNSVDRAKRMVSFCWQNDENRNRKPCERNGVMDGNDRETNSRMTLFPRRSPKEPTLRGIGNDE